MQRLEEIKPHLEQARKLVKQNIVQSMDQSIDYLQKCNQNHIPGSKLSSFQASLDRLKEFKDEFALAENEVQIRELSSGFTTELSNIINKIDGLTLNPVVLEKLQREMSFLNKYQAQLSDLPMNEGLEDFMESNITPASEIESIIQAPELPNDHLPTGSQDRETPINQSVQEARDYMRALRTADSATSNSTELESDAQDHQQDMEQEHIVELDEDDQDVLKNEIKEISRELSKISETDDLSEENKRLAAQSLELCDYIKTNIGGEIDIFKVMSLKNNIEELSQNYPDLTNYIENLSNIIDTYLDSPKPGL